MATNFLQETPPEKREVVLVILAMFFGGFFATVFPPYRTPMIIYTVIAGMTAVVYGLAGIIFNNVPFGLRLKKIGDQILLGLGAAALFVLIKVVVPSFAIGNIAPAYSVSSSVTFLILAVFAPLLEEGFFRGGMFGVFYWIESKGKKITMRSWKFWVANVIQATAFMGWHALAYNQGWYLEPTAAAVATSFIGQSAPFIAAFFWGILAAVIDDLSGRSLIPGMSGHAAINFLVFISLSVVGIPFAVAMPLSLLPSTGMMIIPLVKKRSPKEIYLSIMRLPLGKRCIKKFKML